MGYLFREYCYPDMETAMAAAWSQDQGLERYLITSASVSGSGRVQFSRYLGGDTSAAFRLDTVTFPSCSAPGPYRTDTGLSIADAVELSWLIAAVWIGAYAVKVCRRGL